MSETDAHSQKTWQTLPLLLLNLSLECRNHLHSQTVNCSLSDIRQRAGAAEGLLSCWDDCTIRAGTVRDHAVSGTPIHIQTSGGEPVGQRTSDSLLWTLEIFFLTHHRHDDSTFNSHSNSELHFFTECQLKRKITSGVSKKSFEQRCLSGTACTCIKS